MPTEVHKFGGTSLETAARMQTAAGLVRDSCGGNRQAVVVASAMAGVTDCLLRAIDAAARGDRETALVEVAGLEQRHVAVLDGMANAREVLKELADLVGQVGDLLRSTAWLGEVTGRTRDRILSIGEKLSVRVLAAVLRETGVPAQAVDADAFLETDDRAGNAHPLPGITDRAIGTALLPMLAAGDVPVVTGFCGRGPDGATTTLGRGGSDYSATLVGAALQAGRVTIWTDVDGVFSSDPRIVPDARPIPQLNYREAAELSYYGATVLHQKTLHPVAQRGVPVVVRNTLSPDAPGTRIDSRFSPGSHPVKGISAVPGHALVSVEGTGMAGVPGVAARVFRSLADAAISVTMISQSSSEASICLAVPDADAAVAEVALKHAFRTDISHGEIEDIVVRRQVALVAAIGLGMAHTPGVAARVFRALGRQGVNVLAIAQGSSELNISLAVDHHQIDDAVRTLHDEFGLDRLDTGEDTTDRLDLILIGFGRVGRALGGLVLDREAHVFDCFGLSARVVAIADRSGWLFDPNGLTGEVLRVAGERKAAGDRLDTLDGCTAGTPLQMVQHALRWRLARPVLVDTSDIADVHDLLKTALCGGCDVVTANKAPLAGTPGPYSELIDTARQTGHLLKAEATVGAGLPVVDTIEMLRAAGDELRLAEGCLSGTLTYVMTRLEEGTRFSDAVREALDAGYTEPDPALDLSGEDVARKALILGRLAGLAPDAEVTRTGLIETALIGQPRETLFARLTALDDEFARRVAEAAGNDLVLRFVARVAPGRITVGPEAVPRRSPMGQLHGTDNTIVLQSERYRERPLVVTGPGAGIRVTAMAVLGDIMRIAAERR